MMTVIFEFEVRDGQEAAYFDLAAKLREELDKVDGFIAIERFRSVADPGRFVSISLWRDEAAIAAWRAQRDHRAAQERGKAEIFARFRLLIGEVAKEITFEDGVRRETNHGARVPL